MTATAGATTNLSPHAVYVDSVRTHYFKFHDASTILGGTDEQFEVGWIPSKNRIYLTDGEPYPPVDGESKHEPGPQKVHRGHL